MKILRSRRLPVACATLAVLALAVASCGPSDPVQTIAFVLDLDARKLDRLDFQVKHVAGTFPGTDGGCVAGPNVDPATLAASKVVTVRPAAGSQPGPPQGAVVSSTSTSSTYAPSTTSTTVTSTTTTTTGAASWQCLVTFRLGSAVSFAAAQWNVDYTATGGDFTGLADAVQCRAVSGTGLTPAFNDVDASHSLQVGLFTISSFTGPGDMVECDLTAPTLPVASDFVFSNVEATDAQLELINPPPTISVNLSCSGGPGTTLAPTTTTTLPVNPCGDGVLGSGEECDDGNSLSGDGCDSTCVLEDAFTSTVAPGALQVHIVDRNGIPPGSALAYCKFQGDVTAAKFEVEVDSCSRPAGQACNPATDAPVSVSTTTTTTTTTVSSTTSTTSKVTTTTSTLF